MVFELLLFLKKFFLVVLSGVCIEWVLGRWSWVTFVSQTNQIEASMSNESSCLLQQFQHQQVLAFGIVPRQTVMGELKV